MRRSSLSDEEALAQQSLGSHVTDMDPNSGVAIHGILKQSSREASVSRDSTSNDLENMSGSRDNETGRDG